MHLWTLRCMYPFKLVDSFGIYVTRSGIALSFGNSFILWETSVLFYTMAATIYSPIHSVQRFTFLHIFANTCYFFFWIIVLMTGVCWYLSVVLISISLSDVKNLLLFFLCSPISAFFCIKHFSASILIFLIIFLSTFLVFKFPGKYNCYLNPLYIDTNLISIAYIYIFF